MTSGEEPWLRLMRELFGDDAEAAVEEMRRMGLDPAALAQSSGMDQSPAMMEHVLGRIRSMLHNSAGGDVNWELAHDVARGVAAQGGDPTVTAAQAREYRAAVSEAELWLDAVTDFDPSRATPEVWSKAEWVEATLPMWRALAGPVASSVSQALGGVLRDEGGLVDSRLVSEQSAKGLIDSLSPTVCGMHMGQAAGAMAAEAFGSTDLGFPLLEQPRVALVPKAVESFAAGLDVPADQVRLYLAVREAAHIRLFEHASWLPGQLRTAIERYARGVSVDLDALDSAVRQAGLGDPAALQAALATGIFAPVHSEAQEEVLASIETMLALIEGWVDHVSARAAAPHLPSLTSLREMMRRRRAAGGPAEDTFSALLGLTLRPRRLRDATELWQLLDARLGAQGRDAFWSHPDLLPDAAKLADWRAWADQVTAPSQADAMDAELAALLDGSLDTPSPEEGKGDTNTSS